MVQSIVVAFSNRPQISEVSPSAAIPGGELVIRGKGLTAADRPQARFGDVAAPIVIGSESLLIVKVPEGADRGDLSLGGSDDVANLAAVCPAHHALLVPHGDLVLEGNPIQPDGLHLRHTGPDEARERRRRTTPVA